MIPNGYKRSQVVTFDPKWSKGTFGFFIGFSFMSPWSAMENIYLAIKKLTKHLRSYN